MPSWLCHIGVTLQNFEDLAIEKENSEKNILFLLADILHLFHYKNEKTAQKWDQLGSNPDKKHPQKANFEEPNRA